MLYNALIVAATDASKVSTWELRWMAPHKLIVTAVYQIFFTIRLWSYGRNVLIIMILGLLIVATSVLSVMACYHVWHIEPFVQTSYFWWEQTACSTLIVATDVLLSFYLAVVMLKQRNGFKSTNSILYMITLFTVATGAVNSIFALVNLISVRGRLALPSIGRLTCPVHRLKEPGWLV
ncbi:hypothetical protein DL93DRAFT_2090075 [Clavulina sp. PMI_390]|nr:hypothetical protein DL93DRAFT_2090075 [Clavulina sp. PMI_390]